jgi:hypothetical protein
MANSRNILFAVTPYSLFAIRDFAISDYFFLAHGPTPSTLHWSFTLSISASFFS